MNFAQLGPRLDPELVDQHTASLPVGRQGVGLAAAAIQREHQLHVQALSPRVLRRQPLQLGHQLAVPPGRQIRLDARFHGLQAQLLPPLHLGRRERRPGELLQRRPAPQLQRPTQQLARTARIPRGQRRPARRHRALEALGIELVRLNHKAVSRRRGLQHVNVPERPAQPRHLHRDRLHRPRLGVLAPQRERQTLRAHRPVGMQRQHRQQRPQLRAADRDRTTVGMHLKRTENPNFHRRPPPTLPPAPHVTADTRPWFPCCARSCGSRRRHGSARRHVEVSAWTLPPRGRHVAFRREGASRRSLAAALDCILEYGHGVPTPEELAAKHRTRP